MPSPLVQPFLDEVAVPLRPAFASMIALERRLEELVAAGRAQWPGLELEPTRFVAFVAERLPEGRSPEEALGTMRAADLYLTCACTSGNAAALATFDGQYMGEADLALRRMRASPAQVDEIKQLVRHKLFVAKGRAPGKIAEYSGRGDLRRWVRAIAVRTFLNETRRGKRMVPMADDQLLHGMSASEDDPELAYMKERYRSEFRDAFVQAVKTLGPRQQTLLRYQHVDGLNIDEIGAIYRVHRVTAYRWLEKAREALVKQVHKQLEARLQVEKREFDSILRLIRSQLHLSLIRYLAPGEAPPGPAEPPDGSDGGPNSGPDSGPVDGPDDGGDHDGEATRARAGGKQRARQAARSRPARRQGAASEDEP